MRILLSISGQIWYTFFEVNNREIGFNNFFLLHEECIELSASYTVSKIKKFQNAVTQNLGLHVCINVNILSTSIYDLVLIYVCHFHHHHPALTFPQIWPLSRYSCCYLGSLHPRNFDLCKVSTKIGKYIGFELWVILFLYHYVKNNQIWRRTKICLLKYELKNVWLNWK